MDNQIYNHTQIGWVIIVGLFFALSIGLFVGSFNMALFIGGAILVAGLLFGTLTVSINPESFSFKMGVGVIRKSIPITEIRSWRVVKNSWVYGWGIRFYSGGWLYNVSGFEAVEVHLKNGKQFRVGSDQAATVCERLESIIGPPEALNEEELSTSRVTAVIVTVFLVFLSVGLLFWAQMKPVVVTNTPTGFFIDDFIYDVDVDWESVKDIQLVETIPNISRRTNGFAFNGVLRGHFLLDELGDGRLYIYENEPPFVLLTLSGDDGNFIIINANEKEETQALYSQISQH